MRILISVPVAARPGGVASYYRVLRNRFTSAVDYHYRGSRPGREKTLLQSVMRILKDYWHFYLLVKQNSYQIVQVNTSLGTSGVLRDSLFVLISKVFGCKTVVFFHGWNQDYASSLCGAQQLYFQQTLLKADALIVLATDFADQLAAWGYDNRIYHETTVVDDDLLTQISSLASNQLYTNQESLVTILFLARIERAKGIYEMLEAFRLLQEKKLPVRLLVAGDGADLIESRDKTQDENYKDVIFLGYVKNEEKARAFFDADIYVFPSSYAEGMPTSVLEAMAAGLPIVTRPVGGLKDFFEDGRMGFCTESKDPTVFAELIERLVENFDLCRQIGEYNQLYARNRFLASRVVQRLEDIYLEVVCG